MSINFWEEMKKWKKEGKWIDLSRVVSVNTPHWAGFPAMEVKTHLDIDQDGAFSLLHTLVGQYGTHVDSPNHFVKGARALDTYGPEDMVMPLCVIDKSDACTKNADYALSVSDILEWEKVNGKIPEGCFVAFRSGWGEKDTQEALDNCDTDGNKHYPGWSVDAIRFLVEERNIAAIGHEGCDTDPAVNNDFAAEIYILSQDRFQVEMMTNLDKCPATGAVIFCTFPRVENGSGFTSRCFALCAR